MRMGVTRHHGKNVIMYERVEGKLTGHSTEGLAVGSTTLDMNCTVGTDGANHCVPKAAAGRTGVSTVTTKQSPAPLDAGSACADNSNRYQSWQIQNWERRYQMVPASAQPGTPEPPPDDSGPSFTLRSMANSDVFLCEAADKQDDAFDGTCTPDDGTGGGAKVPASSQKTTYRFDPKLDMITITQHWNCSNS